MRPLLLLALLATTATTTAQVNGGRAVYDFLNLPTSAAAAALGGHHISVRDDDPTLAAVNPALLHEGMSRRIALSHAFQPAGIGNTYLGYALARPDRKLDFHAGLQYTGYGNDLVRRDPTGQAQGTFSANDAALTLGAARHFENDRLTLGANLKFINSQLADFSSFGIGLDAAVHYRDSSSRFQITLLARNFGRQLTQYTPDGRREPMPFELQIGLSRELKYLPFRFEIVYRYLDRWNIRYDDPNNQESAILALTGDELTGESASNIFFDNLARHFVFNGEFLFGKRRNFRVRAGYNHGLRRELRLTNFRTGAGYSFGFAFKTRKFDVAYGRTIYHIGGAVNQLGVGVGL